MKNTSLYLVIRDGDNNYEPGPYTEQEAQNYIDGIEPDERGDIRIYKLEKVMLFELKTKLIFTNK